MFPVQWKWQNFILGVRQSDRQGKRFWRLLSHYKPGTEQLDRLFSQGCPHSQYFPSREYIFPSPQYFQVLNEIKELKHFAFGTGFDIVLLNSNIAFLGFQLKLKVKDLMLSLSKTSVRTPKYRKLLLLGPQSQILIQIKNQPNLYSQKQLFALYCFYHNILKNFSSSFDAWSIFNSFSFQN